MPRKRSPSSAPPKTTQNAETQEMEAEEAPQDINQQQTINKKADEHTHITPAVTLFLVMRSSLRLAAASPQNVFQCGGQDKGAQYIKMTPRIPVEDRKLITKLLVEGLPQRVICQRTGRSKTMVSRIIRAFRDEERIADAQRPRRPRVTQHIEDEFIVAAVVADPFLNASEIRDEFCLEVSRSTKRRSLKEAGLSNCVAAQKPFLTDDNASSGWNLQRSTSIGAKKNGALSFFWRIHLLYSPGSAAAGGGP
ncbi:hypothetical protein HPB48_011072 [Haemaphysalis longicornis]|uniref:Transposase n=1 Tax=Haemaphysalis longicornis TaxID=44386 RepID=A0A9J6GSX0_HAELO|nr:hypothetical protein HPB48_011072 [Haemaphysalis longicornis]